MNIQRATPVNELLARLIFLILPTALVCYFLVWNAHDYFGVIGDLHSGLFSFIPGEASMTVELTLFVTAGMLLSAILYSFRFRFIPIFAAVMLVLWLIYKGLDNMSSSEFDAFFISVQFRTFSILFVAGWLLGWGFIRFRYCAVFISAILLCSCIYLIAKANTDSVYKLLSTFSPALLYSIYIIFTSEQIYNYKDKSQKFWWFLVRRTFVFGLLALLILGGIVYLMRGEIKETVANYGGGGQKGNSMLKKNKDNTFNLEDYSRLRSSLGRSNELLFCAHIDNFFPNSEVPNPLYLTAFYFTKFDTLTETFERDSAIPYNDLFVPNPISIPLFSTKTDSSVIKNSLSNVFRKNVDVEIYTKQLSPTTYLAPNVGYFVQPITVEKDFREEFKTAYRAKSYVSELNSAYFVYNSPDPQIKKFQEQRFAVLKTAVPYTGMDKRFMQYYTYMPSDSKFKSISDLAHKVTAKADKPIDKVLAIRDYFLSKDENGEPLYKYTDNPGVPDIPSASKLMYFLFDNHKGYCAYYAGATLFMLRSLGIPSRIAVGFLTVDRSAGKNKGWYWYYADQAHAWVQVYFPGFGWLDFDTTVGNSDAREAPKPDGTPPMQPPKAWLAADGIVQSVDTGKKLMGLKVNHMVFHDKEYSIPSPVTVMMDMKIATVQRDSIAVPLASIKEGEEATAVSYADAMKKIEAQGNENGTAIIKRFPSPAPIDEVYLKRKDIEKPKEKPQQVQEEKPVSVRRILWTSIGIVGALFLLFMLLPTFVMWYYRTRHAGAKNSNAKAYWAYRTASYYLHQSGVFKGHLTPMQFAKQIVDPQLGTSFTSFMNIYLKQKYAKQQLTANEATAVNNFLQPFLKAAKKGISFGKRFGGFLNPVRTISFFVMPNDEEQEA